MENPSYRFKEWSQTVLNIARAGFWLALAALMLYAVLGSRSLVVPRADLLQRFEQERGTRVIAMIHRRDQLDVLGVPVASHIDIEDSEAVLRAIRLTPPGQPIDIILHTPGGLVLAAEQIAKALAEHKGKITVFVPHYAMSGGTLIALAADQIVMDRNAVLGQVDPQIGDMPAVSILRAVELKGPTVVDDETLILADMAQKARVQVGAFVAQLLSKHLPEEKALQVAALLSEGRWTHDFPIPPQAVRDLGLPVSTDVPRTVYELMDLYPQGRGTRPSVLYVPTRRPAEPAAPAGPAPARPQRD